FQLSALFDSMTVAENLDFPLREHTSLGRPERRRKVAAALERVDLHDVEGKYPAALSGGQQKRAALARAIILEPELMLYDEPTTGLDPVRADGINRLIRRLQVDLGVSGVVVTHDLVSAAAVADRVIMLDEGRVIAEGTLADLHHHENPRVRRFLAGESAPDHAAAAAEGSPDA
ncbi:MAG: ATP-binding cassette domain-containing protein, partial [Planctomycetes bacterium]|nr:ATP-binding cassette domain-containing protein [Planctomycetota bacterium]